MTYADDICLLLADDLETLRVLTEITVCEASRVGLRVNTRKTKNMSIRINDNTHVTIENESIQELGKFVYFGCEISKYGDIRKQVSFGIGKAGTAFRNMEKVLNEDDMSLRTKLKLFNSIVVSVLLYGCETWKGLGEIEERVGRFESGCLRKNVKMRLFVMVSE